MFHESADERRVAASANQIRYVKAEMSGAGTYMIPMGHLVQGPLDWKKFHAAATALILRHDTLRTRFEIEHRTVTALVYPDARFKFHMIEPSDPGLNPFRKIAVPLIFDQVDPREPGSLVRVVAANYGDCWRFTIAAHHAITDGFSRGIMNKELLKLYAGEELPPARSYYDFSQDPASSPDLSQDAREIIGALPKPVRLVGDGIGQGADDDAGQFAARDFQGLNSSLRMLGKAADATKFGILAAAYALGVLGYSGERAVSSFFQTEGRKAFGAPNSVVGPFSNTLPLDLSVDLDQEFASFARNLSEQTRKMVALETEPVLEQVLAVRKAPSISINMFPPASQIRAGDLNIGPREFLDRRTEFDLNLVWAEDGDVMTARAFFNRAQLTEWRAGLFLEFQGRILEAAIENSKVSCREILKIARRGHEAILPQTTADPTPGRRLHEAFFETAERSSNKTAIITTQQQISYLDLAQRVRAIVAALQSAGVDASDRVVIFAQRDPELVAGMLGVSAAGASFALIDSTYPPERIRWMIERLGSRFLIEAGVEYPADLASQVTVISPLSSKAADATIVNGPPRREACHMFTSGTTGRPKLISHPDTTLQRFVSWQARTLNPPERITTLMMAGLAHDPTLRDVFLPLSHGGTVAIPTASEMAQPEALRALLARARCNVLRVSPTTARLLTAGIEANSGFENLRALFWGGERLPHAEIRKWQGLVPQARQFNVFGTTETPQAFLIHEIRPGMEWSRDIPIGRPLPWTGARLVDEEGSAVSTGEVGEIVAELADPVVGVNQKHPLEGPTTPCHHFTGDLGYEMPDGQIYFAGRRDGQVKVNGFRVELGEIEATVEAIPGVERACAILSGDKLMLFVLTAAAAVTDRAIKAALARSLPGYMNPSRIIVTDSFPTTANGKIDREAIVLLAEQDRGNKPEQMIPRDANEEAIAAAFAKASGRRQVYRGDSLFELGADSLSTIETRLVLEAHGFDLPELWEWMPVSDLARHGPAADLWDQETGWRGQIRRLDTFIVLRSLAIALVVMHHSGVDLLVGASLILIALAGYSFGRLHLPAIVKDGRTGRIWALIAKLLVPLLPASIILFAAHTYVGNAPHVAGILLYENVAQFVDIEIFHQETPRHHMFWLWFLHAYLQIFLLFGLLLGIPKLRGALAIDPWRAVLVFFVIAEVAGAGLILLLSGPLNIGNLEDVSGLLQHSPITILPFFTLGALLALADGPGRRAATLALGVAHWALAQFVYVGNEEVAWLAALALCVLVPYVPLPRFVTTVLMALSGHALMIYLSHRAVTFALDQALPGLVPMPLSIVLQLSAGVLLGIGLRPVLNRLGVNRLSNMRISFGARQPVSTQTR